jgi:N-ethylmaleimide reductase
MVMPGNCSYHRMPGVFSDEQTEAWRGIVNAVHAQGGKMYLQLWHGGRTSHALLNGGVEPVAPSAIRIESDGVHTPQGKVPFAMPRELTAAEITGIVEAFGRAAANAKRAGFDGVEVHGANGYLIDQFLRDGSNKRSDAYGGGVTGRLRFLREVLESVVPAFGPTGTGLRISPLNSYHEMLDNNPVELTASVAKLADEFQLGYLHVMRGDFFSAQQGDVLTPARENFKGVLLANMGYTAAEADAAISNGQVDAVAFGHHYISNPDLPNRFRQGAAVVEPDTATYYTHDAKGYTDYPALAA